MRRGSSGGHEDCTVSFVRLGFRLATLTDVGSCYSHELVDAQSKHY